MSKKEHRGMRIDEKTIKIDKELLRLEVRGGHYGALSDLVALNAEMAKKLIKDLKEVLPALQARDDEREAKRRAEIDAHNKSVRDAFEKFGRMKL